MEESLPNIKGHISGNQRNGYENHGIAINGAFSLSSLLKVFYSNDMTMNMLSGLGFDASLSSSVYQDNAHVRPLSITTTFLIRY